MRLVALRWMLPRAVYSQSKARTDVHSPSPGAAASRDSSLIRHFTSMLASVLRVAPTSLPQTHVWLMRLVRRVWGSPSGFHLPVFWTPLWARIRLCPPAIQVSPCRITNCIKPRWIEVHLDLSLPLMAETSRLLEAATVLSAALGASRIPHSFHGSFLISLLSNSQQCNVRLMHLLFV